MGRIRRRIRRLTTLMVCGVLIIGVGTLFYLQNNDLVVDRIDLSNDRVGAVRIVHLSDIHGKQFGEQNSLLLETVLEQQPDLVVVTGDMIDYSATTIDDIAVFLARINDRIPTVCIPGNHEGRSQKREEFFSQLRDVGVAVLENEILAMHVDGSTINILGLDERTGDGAVGATTQALFAELAAMPGLRVVLSHYPQYYALIGEASYQRFDFDVMFSGHAHGGQWILPGVGGLYARGQGLFPTYYRGLYDDRLIVSAGLGNSHYAPRLFNPPQVIVVQINR